MNKQLLVDSIMDFLVDNKLTGDVYIYSDNKRYHVDENHNITIKDNIIASEISEYMVDDWVNMTFEGTFNHILNYPDCGYDYRIVREFDCLLHRFDCYCELGNSWNLKVVPSR